MPSALAIEVPRNTTTTIFSPIGTDLQTVRNEP